jgi:hypothetical protein
MASFLFGAGLLEILYCDTQPAIRRLPEIQQYITNYHFIHQNLITKKEP